MSSVDKLQEQKRLAKGEVLEMRTDNPVAIRLKYVGDGSVSSVSVTTATKITLTTSGDSGVDFEFATYDTVGKLVDAINAYSYWEAKVLDTIRSEDTASQFVDGAVSENTDVSERGVYDINVDTSAAQYFAARLTYDRGFLKEGFKNSHRVRLSEIVYLLNVGDAPTSADNLKIYEIDKNGNEILRMAAQPVDDTETTINFASGRVSLDAENGNDLVVKIDDGTSIADSNGNFLRLVGIKE
jgi:hypothetical protein